MMEFAYEMQQVMWCAVIIAVVATLLLLVAVPQFAKWLWRRYEQR